MADARLTIGRLGLSVSTGETVDALPNLTWDGDRLTITGEIHGPTEAAGSAMRQQLNGYSDNPDEEIIPVTWSGDTTAVNGYYRFLSGNIEANAGTYVGGSWWFHFTIEIERVPGWQYPLFEILCKGAERVDVHGGDGVGWVGIPGTAVSVDSLDSPTTVSTVGGDSVIVGTGDTFYDEAPTYTIAASDFYDAAATLTMNGYTVVGRQVVSDGDGWIISNGLVKIRPSLTSANHLVVGVRNSGATDYDEKAYRLGQRSGGTSYELGYAAPTRYAPLAVTVLRNAPECVTIRLTFKVGAISTLAGVLNANDTTHSFIDITLRRGQTYAEIRVTGSVGTAAVTKQWGLWRGTLETSVDVTSGVGASAADASSNKYQIFTPVANTVDTVNGGVYIDTTSNTATFGVGNNRSLIAVTMKAQFFAAQTHRQFIVAR